MNPGDWAWSTEHEAICRVVDVQTVWDHTLYRVWRPTKMRSCVFVLTDSHPSTLIPQYSTSSTSRTLSLRPGLPMPSPKMYSSPPWKRRSFRYPTKSVVHSM
jgi:hypothetical protein